jgi:peptidoglycan/xylan/chitin deacetylase (PgdA/CDA1 family)
MRFDRFITLRIVRPLRRLINVSQSDWAVPILMYHDVSERSNPGVSAYHQTSTSPAVFRQHIKFLADSGYQTISLKTLLKSLTNGDGSLRSADCPAPNSVLITFDDGFQTVYTEAFPVLHEYGFTASVHLPTAFIGDERCRFAPVTPNGITRFASFGDCLNWAEILELRRHGFEIGSHTVNHPQLFGLSWPDIKAELLNSKRRIEQQLGESISAFCYPFAFPRADKIFVQKLREMLSEIGYTCCLTTELGRIQPGTDPYRLKRLPLNSLDDSFLLEAKLRGDYDWLGLPQRAFKTLNRLGLPG